MIIEENNYFDVSIEENNVYIQTKNVGYPIKNFETIIKNNPRIKLLNFAALKSALTEITDLRVAIGIWLPLIEIDISPDRMSAFAIVNEHQRTIMQMEEIKGSIS